MGVIGFVFGRILPATVLALAVIIGWLSRQECPEGVFFATFIPLFKGHLPPAIFGHGRMSGTMDVPEDMLPQRRPKKEMFLTLPGNHKMPQNGIGMCCRPTAYDDELVRRSVLWYLLSGGRLIDTAHLYLNHQAIGQAIKQAIDRGVPRTEIFVTTKIWPSNYGRNATKDAVQLFLQELDLEYVDLVLMHQPRGLPFMKTECSKAALSHKECRQETWKSLTDLRHAGLTKNVGISNFNTKQIKELQDLKLAPIAVHQMQYNLWAPDHSVETFEYCQKHKIAVTAYASLGGLFQHSQTLTIDTLNAIADKHDKTVAQIMLRWALQKNAAIIPGTGNPKHMMENLDVYNFKLSKEDMDNLEELRSDEMAKSFFYMPTDDS